MSREWAPGDEIVRRAKHGTRRRSVVTCANCRDKFVRLGNTRYCSDLCRFVDKLSIDENGCWQWQATLDRHGYGTFYLGRNLAAHRVAYALIVGDIPDGLHIDHLCRNRACVNPTHLEAVPQRVNTLRGQAPSAVAFRESRCKQGHARSFENTYVNPNDPRHRQCRICMKQARAKREGRAA